MILPLSTQKDIAFIRELEDQVRAMPNQYLCPVQQSIHAGIYTRICEMPANSITIGALMKIPTMLIVVGDCTMTIGDQEKAINVHGFACFQAPAGRKTAFRCYSDTKVIMSFATKAKTCEEARWEFTDEKLQGE